ncbi:hypothetical protein GCM10028827_42970 [Mucilaginibacter myungsuensis]
MAQGDNARLQKQMKAYDSIITELRYRDPDSAQLMADKAMDHARLNNYKAGEAMMLHQFGLINDNQGKYGHARKNYQDALAIYRSLKDDKGIVTETNRLGVVELRSGNYDKAIEFHLNALQLSEKAAYARGLAESNIGLAEDHIWQRSYPMALKYLRTADSVNKTLPFSSLYFNIANSYGMIYREMSRLNEAKASVELGLKQAVRPKFNGSYITLTNTLASIHVKEGDIKKAITLQKEALAISRDIKNYLRQMESLINLAVSYLQVDNKESLKYLHQARTLAATRQSNKLTVNALEKMSALYEKLGDDKTALDLKKEQYAIADSLFYREMSDQVAAVKSTSELNKSRMQVEAMNERQKLERKIIIGGALVALLIIGGIGFFYYQLRKLNRGLADTNKTKDRLLSVLAHDLRAPFISMIGLLQVIDDADLTPADRKKMLGQLEKTSKASLETLDGLLKWGQMQIKGIKIAPIRFEIGPVIARTFDLLAESAEQKQILLKDLVDPGLAVYCDVDHFEFMMRNLVSNAIKFTPVGGRVWIIGVANKDQLQATITVKDNGVGMSELKQSHIFSLDNESTQGTTNEKGTGMGLLMCKEYAEANHGKIGVVSAPGSGSDFYITLPM